MFMVVWALIASFFAAYYYFQYNDFSNRVAGALIYVNVGVDFGNGTRVFSNNTETIISATLFNVTKQAFNVSYDVTSSGIEIKSIDGVQKTGGTGGYGWTYWLWNSTESSWSIVWEGAAVHEVANEETYMWYYQNSFNPPS